MITRLTAAVIATAALLCAPAAHAEPPSPLHTLVDTAALRLQTAEPVAAYKWLQGGAITDAARAQQVLDTAAADGQSRSLDPGYVRDVFRAQIDANEGIQYTRFGQWKLDPATAPRSAEDLSQSRAAINGYNRTIIEQIALHRDSLTGPACGAELIQAQQQVIAERGLDPLHRQALESATRALCHTA